MDNLKLSVVIPSLNEEHYIGSLLTSLKQQTRQPYEIIVVDCGSTDKTVEVVKRYKNITIIEREKPVGNQRTQGGIHATGDFLLFLDSDVILERNFIEDSLIEIVQRKLSVACPRYIPYPGSLLIRAFYAFFNVLFYVSQSHRPSGAGSGIFVSKDVFGKVGGFDASMVFDDIVFIRNASQHGKFGMLHTHIQVSDRRIRKYGLFHTILIYILLSLCFLFGFYRLANYVPYSFGMFRQRSKKV